MSFNGGLWSLSLQDVLFNLAAYKKQKHKNQTNEKTLDFHLNQVWDINEMLLKHC